MFASNQPTLRVRRPTPTTIEYTVTTRPTTFLTPSRILLFILRTLLLTAVALLLLVKYYVSSSADPSTLQQPFLRPIHHWSWWSVFALLEEAIALLERLFAYVCMQLTLLVSRSQTGNTCVTYVRGLSWLYTTAIALGGVWVASRREYTEESLLILRGLGIQTATSSDSYLTGTTYRFLPTTAIQDILIHEGFVGFEVKFYLFVVVKGEGEIVVVFPKLLPRRKILEEVWRGTRSCLYEPQS